MFRDSRGNDKERFAKGDIHFNFGSVNVAKILTEHVDFMSQLPSQTEQILLCESITPHRINSDTYVFMLAAVASVQVVYFNSFH